MNELLHQQGDAGLLGADGESGGNFKDPPHWIPESSIQG